MWSSWTSILPLSLVGTLVIGRSEFTQRQNLSMQQQAMQVKRLVTPPIRAT